MTPFKNLIALKFGQGGGGGGGGETQTKSVTYTPSETQQTAEVKPDSGKTLSKVNVTVEAVSSSYVGSSIDRNDSTDLTASGDTVSVRAGYYAAAASKSVASGSAATPATTITANPSISVDSSGLITATASASQSVTPTVSAGYVSSGTSGTVTVSGSSTEQLTTQAAQTIHPSTSDQTIASGKYLTGAQTIKAVTTNITADKIVSGFTAEIGDSDDSDCVASVTGTASGGTDVLAERIENTMTSYTYNGTSDLPPYLFYNCTSLESVSMPNVTAMLGGTNGKQFGGCSNLQTVNFQNLASIGSAVFDSCSKLSSAIFPSLTTMGGGNFAYGSSGNRTYVFPALTSITAADSFRGNATYTIDFGPGLTSLPTRTFYASCPLIILRCATQVVTADAAASINNVGANTTVYIPKALYDHLDDGTALDYRAATNWSAKTTTTFACIEGSQYENYYADGTPIPTT